MQQYFPRLDVCHECAGSVEVNDSEIKIGQPSSKSGRVRCIHFRTNTIVKDTSSAPSMGKICYPHLKCLQPQNMSAQSNQLFYTIVKGIPSIHTYG